MRAFSSQRRPDIRRATHSRPHRPAVVADLLGYLSDGNLHGARLLINRSTGHRAGCGVVDNDIPLHRAAAFDLVRRRHLAVGGGQHVLLSRAAGEHLRSAALVDPVQAVGADWAAVLPTAAEVRPANRRDNAGRTRCDRRHCGYVGWERKSRSIGDALLNLDYGFRNGKPFANCEHRAIDAALLACEVLRYVRNA